MTLNISPESKIGKVQDWDANKFLKGDVDTYYIGEDTISRENLKKYLEQSNFSIGSNGVLYRTDSVGCIPGILDIWFNQRVEYKNEMKKYGKAQVTKKSMHSFTNVNWFRRFYLTLYMVYLGFLPLGSMMLIMLPTVTTTGQTVIKSTADMGNIKYNKELGESDLDSNIYIDTDSVFFSVRTLT